MIEIVEGLWIAPEHVTMVKDAGDDKCLIYFVGQSALDGHLLPFPASEVAEVIEESFMDEVDDEDADQNEE